MQGGNTSGVEEDSIDWDSEDEREIENFSLPCSRLTIPGGEAAMGSAEV